MFEQYRLTWTFVGRPPLVRLVRFGSDGAAVRAARAPEFYRGIFRRAGLVYRSRSEFEYMDRFPVPSGVHVERVRR
jgi:hypothetical protein